MLYYILASVMLEVENELERKMPHGTFTTTLF